MEQSNPFVTVFITHHLDENRKYLDLCMRAIAGTKNVPIEVIVLADTNEPPVVLPGMQLVHDKSLNTSIKKVHYGMTLAHPESKHFLFLSDDVVVSEMMLANMVGGLGESRVIMTPMSNSDLGSRFVAQLPFPQTAEYEEFADKFSELATYETNLRLLVKQEWLSFYCVLIPRSVWNLVGELDEALETRHNDEDYCYRAHGYGVHCFINFCAFAFHFGSKTLSKSVLPGEQDEASRHFFKKWGKSAMVEYG